MKLKKEWRSLWALMLIALILSSEGIGVVNSSETNRLLKFSDKISTSQKVNDRILEQIEDSFLDSDAHREVSL